MSTYTDASLIYYPSGYKAGTAYSLKPTDGSGDLTFTRASSATRVNADGLIEQVPYNLVQQSNTFNTTWIPSGLSRTANTIANPLNGAVNAYTLTLNSGTASKFITQPISQSGVYTQSVYLKSGTHQFVQLLVGSDASHYANFDLVNGTFSSFGSTIDATIESVIGGWYRCTFTYNTSTGQDVYIWAVNSLSSARAASTSSSGDFYIYGFQLNSGATAKPYFPTTDRLNVPRIDYTGGGCAKLLLEPQRTNLVLRSQEFDNASWNKTDVSVLANSVTSPSGLLDADVIVENSISSQHRLLQYVTISNATTYTTSLYVKRVTGTRDFGIINTVSGQRVYFNLTTGTVGSQVQGTGTITDVGNGWYRCTVTGTSTGTSANVFLCLTNGTNAGNETYLGDGVSSLAFYAAQTEVGSFPTSIIHTTTTAVTRVGDACLTTNLQSSSIIGATQGTFFLNTTKTTASTWINQRIFETGTTTRSFLLDNSGGQIRLRVWDASSVGPTITTSGLVEGFVKYLIKWDGTNVKVFANGVLQGSSAAPSYAYNTYSAYESVSYSNNAINQFLFFPTALSDAECIALTTL